MKSKQPKAEEMDDDEIDQAPALAIDAEMKRMEYGIAELPPSQLPTPPPGYRPDSRHTPAVSTCGSEPYDPLGHGSKTCYSAELSDTPPRTPEVGVDGARPHGSELQGMSFVTRSRHPIELPTDEHKHG